MWLNYQHLPEVGLFLITLFFSCTLGWIGLYSCCLPTPLEIQPSTQTELSLNPSCSSHQMVTAAPVLLQILSNFEVTLDNKTPTVSLA